MDSPEHDDDSSSSNSCDHPFKKMTLPSISKSWMKESSHVPLYSGGKISLSSHRHKEPFVLTQCDRDVAILDVSRGVLIATIRSCENYDGDYDGDYDGADHEAITSYCLSPNDITLITAHRNSLLKLHDISTFFSHKTTKETRQTYSSSSKNTNTQTLGRSGHDLPVHHMSFHASGKFFATGSVDSRSSIWDIQRRYITHTFRHSGSVGSGGGLIGSVTSLYWCHDVTKLWVSVGREDGSIHIHDLKMEDVVKLGDHLGVVTCTRWNAECRVFVTGGRDEVVHMYGVVEEDRTHTQPQKSTRMMTKRGNVNGTSVVKREHASSKITYRHLYTLPVYESILSLQIIPSFHLHSKYSHISPSDLLLATAGSKGIVRLWKASINKDVVSRLVKIRQQGDKSAFGSERGGYTGCHIVNWGHNQNRNTGPTSCLLAVDAEHNLTFLNLSHDQLLEPIRKIVGNNGEILDLKIIPHDNTRRIAVATNSPQIKLFELGTYNCQILDGHTDTVLSLIVSPCGKYLVTSSKDKTSRLWNLHSNKCVAIAKGHTESVSATALSQKIGRYEVDGKGAMKGEGAFFISGSKDHMIKRWNLPGGSVLERNDDRESGILELEVFVTERAHEKDINVVTIAPGDSFICTGSQDKTAKLWNALDLTPIGTLSGHKRGVWDCQFSNHDQVVATSSGDSTVKLWSIADRRCVRTFQGHSGSVLRVRFLSSGLQLLSSGGDGLIKLWTIRTNECETTLDAHDDRVWAMDVSSDGQTLCSGGADAKIVVWRDTTVDEEEKDRKEEELNILMEQMLANHLQKNNFELALDMSLNMDKPSQALKVLISIIENGRTRGLNDHDILVNEVKCWSINRIVQVLRYCRDWNTRSRNSHVAMLMFRAIMVSIPAATLANEDGVPDIMEGIMPYTERHFERIDRLKTDSFIIDYFLNAMGVMDMNDVDGIDGTKKKNSQYAEWKRRKKWCLPPKERLGVGIEFTLSTSNGTNPHLDDEVDIVGESDSTSSPPPESSDSEMEANGKQIVK